MNNYILITSLLKKHPKHNCRELSPSNFNSSPPQTFKTDNKPTIIAFIHGTYINRFLMNSLDNLYKTRPYYYFDCEKYPLFSTKNLGIDLCPTLITITDSFMLDYSKSLCNFSDDNLKKYIVNHYINVSKKDNLFNRGQIKVR